MDRKLYIAYGSNLSVEQMDYRCPDATIVGTATLAEGDGRGTRQANTRVRQRNENVDFFGTTFGQLISGPWLRTVSDEGGFFKNGMRDRYALSRRRLFSRSGLTALEQYLK